MPQTTVSRRASRRRRRAGLAAAIALLATASGAVADTLRPPYWASINRSQAIMRRGPSELMRAMWQYQRMGLPVRVLAVREDWRQVQDPDGTVGWMHKRLLSGRRTAIVTGGMQAMHTSPSIDAPVAFRASPGVVGRISECSDGWCLFDVMGQTGWIATSGIWGD